MEATLEADAQPVTPAMVKEARMARLCVSVGARKAPPPLTVRSVYVMLSRVMYGRQLLPMPCSGFEHLKTLHHDEELRLFQLSFNEDGFFDESLLSVAAQQLEDEGRAVAAENKAKKRAERTAVQKAKRVASRANSGPPGYKRRQPDAPAKAANKAASADRAGVRASGDDDTQLLEEDPGAAWKNRPELQATPQRRADSRD